MKTFMLIMFTLFLSILATAQVSQNSTATATTPSAATTKPPAKEIVNQVIFSEGSNSWTARDLALYKKVVSAYTKHDKISEFSDSFVDDFLISRLLKNEALLFEIHPQEQFAYNPSKFSSGDYTKKEIEDELKTMSYVVALLDLKEKQLTQKARFRAWVDVLKRKYQVKMKTNDVSKS